MPERSSASVWKPSRFSILRISASTRATVRVVQIPENTQPSTPPSSRDRDARLVSASSAVGACFLCPWSTCVLFSLWDRACHLRTVALAQPEKKNMARVISVEAERFPIAGTFTISRGSKTEAEVITCTIGEGGHSGRGECVPYKRYGETMDSVRDGDRGRAARQLRRHRPRQRCSMRCRRAPRATRSTARYGTWKPRQAGGRWPRRSSAGPPPHRWRRPSRCRSATPEAMAAQARANAARPLLKVKIGGEGDIERIRAVVASSTATAASSSTPMKAGRTDNYCAKTWRSRLNSASRLIEQPLPAGQGRDSAATSRVRFRSAPTRAFMRPKISTRWSASTMPSTSSSTRPAA